MLFLLDNIKETVFILLDFKINSMYREVQPVISPWIIVFMRAMEPFEKSHSSYHPTYSKNKDRYKMFFKMFKVHWWCIERVWCIFLFLCQVSWFRFSAHASLNVFLPLHFATKTILHKYLQVKQLKPINIILYVLKVVNTVLIFFNDVYAYSLPNK